MKFSNIDLSNPTWKSSAFRLRSTEEHSRVAEPYQLSARADLLQVLRLHQQEIAQGVERVEQRDNQRDPQVFHALSILVHVADRTHCACKSIFASLIFIAWHPLQLLVICSFSVYKSSEKMPE